MREDINVLVYSYLVIHCGHLLNTGHKNTPGLQKIIMYARPFFAQLEIIAESVTYFARLFQLILLLIKRRIV